MLIFKRIFTRRTAIFILGAIIILLAQAPLLKTHTNIDYDSPLVVAAINNCLGLNSHFAVDRIPGSPVYILTSAALMFWVKKFFGEISTSGALWVLSILMSWLTLIVFYQRSKKIADSHWIQGLMLLSLALHPIFIWHSFSAVEDMFALFCFALSLLMVRKQPLKNLAWIIFAMGVGAKISLIGTFPLVFAFYIDKDSGADALSVIKQLAEPLMIVVLVSVLLMLPAAANFGMDPTVMFKTNNYGTVFKQRLGIGWFLTWTTILWWIPFGFYLIIQYVTRLVKYRKLTLIEIADIPVLLIFLACLKPRFILTLVIVVIVFVSLIVIILYYLQAKGNANREFQFSKALLIVLSVPCSIIFIMLCPFSRSFLLFALIPILYSMSLRCRSVIVWVFIAIFSYVSMFHYVQVTGKKIMIHDFGYYEAFLKQKNNHFNDYGFVNDVTRQKEIYFFWAKRK